MTTSTATDILLVANSTLTPWVDTLGAVLLALGSALLALKDTLNWRQSVADEFAERSAGLRLGQLFGPVHLAGLGVATASVVSGL